ncbi:MAG: endonuclease III [Planctomycetes bacterium]|nr:endonuclease III [Planctomycetota bacterium]
MANKTKTETARIKNNAPAVETAGAAQVKFYLKALARVYPDATCALEHKNALELLVATILSAQCTDKRVNMVTRELFRKYQSPADYADAPAGELEEAIRSTGFFNNKAKSIRGAAAALRDRYANKVPDTMEALLTLPGVARKTANVVLGTAHGIPSGIVVDTHVSRLSQRLGLTAHDKPEKIEKDLIGLIPKKAWIDFSHQLIWHGRRVCKARKPACDLCALASHCPSCGRC